MFQDYVYDRLFIICLRYTAAELSGTTVAVVIATDGGFYKYCWLHLVISPT